MGDARPTEIDRVIGYVKMRPERVPDPVKALGFFSLLDFLELVIEAVHAAGGAREPADDDACDCGEDTVMGCALRPSRHCGNTWPDEEGARDG